MVTNRSWRVPALFAAYMIASLALFPAVMALGGYAPEQIAAIGAIVSVWIVSIVAFLFARLTSGKRRAWMFLLPAFAVLPALTELIAYLQSMQFIRGWLWLGGTGGLAFAAFYLWKTDPQRQREPTYKSGGATVRD